MELSDTDIVRFEYVYGGRPHQCAYLVTGGMLVAVVGQMERSAALDRMLPERLARILVHELLVEAELSLNAKGSEQESDKQSR
ncbi:hypothetical protein [Bradyrhizobium japonicum]|jgi:hypothetical protein|uniref:hypothetical protein n=1 Tax=Bradyrhizobium japonicum TaxID=375 RepID=UPI00040077AE|nr:hypothetical protein [Bradyrhizobium japonicum]